MPVRRHKNAATNPKVRKQLREESKTKSARQLAKKYDLSVDAVMKWKNRTSEEDASTTPHRLQTAITNSDYKQPFPQSKKR